MENKLYISLLFCLSLLNACQRDETDEVFIVYPSGNAFTLNNVKYTMSNDSATGYHDDAKDWTIISVKDSHIMITMRFPFSRKGTFKFSTANATHFEITTGIKRFVFFNPPDGKDMVIMVTRYDSIGGRIKGNFYGDMEEEQWPKDDLTVQKPAAVSLGSFDVKRTK